jgi:hypothetical protein
MARTSITVLIAACIIGSTVSALGQGGGGGGGAGGAGGASAGAGSSSGTSSSGSGANAATDAATNPSNQSGTRLVRRLGLYDGDSTYTNQPKQSEQHREPDQRPARFANCCTGTPQRKRFNDHTGRPDRLNEWSRSSREARSGLVGPGPRQ